MSVTLVGSRKAPDYALDAALQIGIKLAKSGEPMYSGGAPGMDDRWERSYIEAGCGHLLNIILPQKGFNGRKPDGINYTAIETYDRVLLEYADELIQEVHEYYHKLDGFSYWAHIRNCFQVLGHDLKSPSTECFLYAPVKGSGVTGGTSTAYNLCKKFNIPTYNIADSRDLAYLKTRFKIKDTNLNFLWD